jgi:hypothetical protein
MDSSMRNGADGGRESELVSWHSAYRHTDTTVSPQTGTVDSLRDMDGEGLAGLDKERLLVRAAFKYLSTRYYSQWGIWEITRPDHRLEAAKWLADQIDNVDTVLRRDQV